MKAGDEKCIDGKKYVWVVCPDCREGRYVLSHHVRRPLFSGRCRKCSLALTKQEFGRYFPRHQVI